MNLETFGKEFMEDILALANAEEDGEFRENTFTQEIFGYLTEVGECIDPKLAFFSERGVKVNGWDLDEESDSIDLFVSLFFSGEPFRRLQISEVRASLYRCRRFLERAIGGLWEEMEESSDAFEAAQTIHSLRNHLKKVRIYLLTNGIAPSKKVDPEKFESIEITYHIFDLERLFQVSGSGDVREPIEITLSDLKGGLYFLQLPQENKIYDSYLGMVPGSVLSDLYSKWGQRLLEQNVRSYLQARGSVNRGILDTIKNSPRMFFAYNNGISAVADSVEVEKSTGNIVKVTGLKNFQIVNGAQTTASLSDALKNRGADLTEVFVQTKLTVPSDHSSLSDLVPLISRYANTQTKVNLSDFSANNPYHIQLEKISRLVWVPSEYGKSTTKWYFERTRGEYINDVNAEGTVARKRAFKLLYPKKQMLNKTSVAKYEMSWRNYPHIVSLGSEKNFSRFMDLVMREHINAEDEVYFKRLVAKAILFKECDKTVAALNYGGYKANVVTYTVSWLSYITAHRIDLDDIWRRQGLTSHTVDAIKLLSAVVWKHINEPPQNARNISEWCKRPICWEKLRERMQPELGIWDELVSTTPENNTNTQTGEAQDSGSSDNEISQVLEFSPEFWFSLAAWAKKTGNLQSWQRGLAFSIGRLLRRNRHPSIKQAKQALIILSESRKHGFVEIEREDHHS